jgi:hypothetical protein
MAQPDPQKYRRSRPSAVPLALFFATGYFVAAVAGGTALSGPDGERLPTLSMSTDGTRTAAPPARTTAPTSTTPAGFREVTGPHLLKTVLPEKWRVRTGAVPTTLVATDPDDPRREVRFGGAPVSDPSTDLSSRIRRVAGNTKVEGYRRTAVESSRFHDYPAIRWDYEYLRDDEPRQVSTFYWEALDIEYVIYAASAPEEWTTVQVLVQTMKEHTRP